MKAARGAGIHSRNALVLDDYVLTVRETEILSLAAEGKGNKDISELMGISVHTVKVHMSHIFFKLGARKRGDAVRKALFRGQIQPRSGIPAA